MRLRDVIVERDFCCPHVVPLLLTHRANDDAERMVEGDPAAESVFFWDKTRNGVDRRGTIYEVYASGERD